MHYYALHVTTTLSPGGITSPEHSERRIEIEWPTPIEYASDLKEIEECAAKEILAAWRKDRIDRLTNMKAQAFVHILNWQPLKGYQRPQDEGGEEPA